MSSKLMICPKHNDTLILDKVFNEVISIDPVNGSSLKEAFYRVENQFPGFSQEFIVEMLRRLLPDSNQDISQIYLRLACLREYVLYRNPNHPEFDDLEVAAQNLKCVLSKIPETIDDRRRFIDLIKEIASAIKKLLDSTVYVIDILSNGSHKKSLEDNKNKFLNYSRRFSNNLKVYFRDKDPKDVFSSAVFLVNQANLIIFVVRDYK